MLKDIAKDPKAAADVFMMPHDQIGQMAEAGLIYPNTKYEKKSKKTISTRQSQESLGKTKSMPTLMP